jgi:hypothetical protein
MTKRERHETPERCEKETHKSDLMSKRGEIPKCIQGGKGVKGMKHTKAAKCTKKKCMKRI